MDLRCKLGFHAWNLGPTAPTRYSKGGILAGSVDTCDRVCSRCASSTRMYRYGSFLRYFADDTGWRPIDSPELAACVADDYLPLAELTAFNLAKNKAKLAAADGTNCKCGRPWKRVKSDHGYRWWHSHYCNYCYKYSGVYYYEDKPKGQRRNVWTGKLS